MSNAGSKTVTSRMSRPGARQSRPERTDQRRPRQGYGVLEVSLTSKADRLVVASAAGPAAARPAQPS